MVQPVSLIFFCQQSIRHQKTHHLDHQIWSEMLSQPSVSFHQVALAILSAFSGACTVLLVQLPMKALTLDSLDLRPAYPADFHSGSSLVVSVHVMQSSSDCVNLCPFTQQLIHGLSPGQISGVVSRRPTVKAPLRPGDRAGDLGNRARALLSRYFRWNPSDFAVWSQQTETVQTW